MRTIWKIIILVLIFAIIFIRTKVRGYFWKVRKTGEELTLKQFFKLWRRGIDGITLIQQLKSQIMGTWIVITGMLAGMIVNAIVRLKAVWWWLEIILFGSLIITSMGMVGTLQKYWRQKQVEETIKELEEKKK